MFDALKRLNIYQKEMYPIISRLLLGYLVFGEIYFIILLNHGIIDVKFGIQELVCGFTVFSFLFWLRIADDFKDYELDCRLFKERPLPSGRVTKKDLGIFITILIAITLVLNFIYSTPHYAYIKLPYQILQAAVGAVGGLVLCFKAGLLERFDKMFRK